MSENAKIINRKLLEYFGTGRNSEKQLFRLVWSEGLTEKRFGIFSKWYGHIYLGEETGVKEVKKYNWVKERWVLEVYTPTQKSVLDIKLGDDYETVWVFQDNKGEYLRPIWPVVEILCKTWINQVVNPKKRTEKMDASDYEIQLNKEVEDFIDMLEVSTPMQTRFRYGEAVILPGEKKDGGEGSGS